MPMLPWSSVYAAATEDLLGELRAQVTLADKLHAFRELLDAEP